jgi:coenzyme Q-binding protein COQ10|tara:strand:- start:32 stop:493 length:462 start_codon:yes stop_codon:yes gene_type:complete
VSAENTMPTHNETKILRHSAQQMYDLVADVAAYPEFLPWCAAARIKSVTPDGVSQIMEADLVISFKVFRERFGSRVILHSNQLFIDTEYLDGPFKHMKSTWKFESLSEGCAATFFVDFEFKNAILQGVIGLVFNEAMQRIVLAFEARAESLYN